MAIPKINSAVKDHKKVKTPSQKLRRKENKRRNRNQRNSAPSSKHFADRLRQARDLESRQSRHWLTFKQQEGLISGPAAKILHGWIKAKTPTEQGRLVRLSEDYLGTNADQDAHNEALLAWATLKREREEAMGQGSDGATVDDWWNRGVSKGKGVSEQDEFEDMEHAGGVEENGFGDEDDEMSVVSDEDGGYDEDEEGGIQLEPPEPVSP